MPGGYGNRTPGRIFGPIGSRLGSGVGAGACRLAGFPGIGAASFAPVALRPLVAGPFEARMAIFGPEPGQSF